MSQLLCLCCGETVDVPAEGLLACPACGCGAHVPADLDDTVTITLTRHELRVLTFWAANYERALPADMRHDTSVIGFITDRLAIQTDAPLSLSQEISDIRAEFGTVTVVDQDGMDMGL